MHIVNTMSDHYGELHARYTAIVTLLDVFFYLFLAYKVGEARGKYKVEAPSTDGPAAFKRIYRVHMNTLEQMVPHFALLWLAAFAVGDKYAALTGGLWLLGRLLYAHDYLGEPKMRARGFFVALFANAVLFISVIASIISSF